MVRKRIKQVTKLGIRKEENFVAAIERLDAIGHIGPRQMMLMTAETLEIVRELHQKVEDLEEQVKLLKAKPEPVKKKSGKSTK